MAAQPEQTFDVVVIGGGLAGSSAAIEAAKLNATVLLIEREPRTGGNSAKASSGLNAWGTPVQTEADSAAQLQADTMRVGQNVNVDSVVGALAEDANAAWNFVRGHGAELDAVTKCGGHSVARTHRPVAKPGERPINAGGAIMNAMRAATQDGVTTWTGTKVTSLRKQADGSWQLQCECAPESTGASTVSARAVVVATGGFAGSKASVEKFAPKTAKFATTNGPFADGSGLPLLESVGATLEGLDRVQVHPTGFVDPANPDAETKMLCPEALRGLGGKLVDASGKRFVDELMTRAEVTAAILENGNDKGHASLVIPQSAVEAFGEATFGFYEMKKLVRKVPAGVDAELGYDAAAVLGEGTTVAWVATVTPCRHYCMGGAKIDEGGRVIGTDGVVDGLYAAGEVTCGTHGLDRLAGNSLLECVVFGRRAGRNAAESVRK